MLLKTINLYTLLLYHLYIFVSPLKTSRIKPLNEWAFSANCHDFLGETEHFNRKNRTLRWSIQEEKQKSNAQNPCANTHGFLWDILFGHFFATSRCPRTYGKSQLLLKWYSSTLATGFRFSPTSLWFQRSRAWLCLLVFSCRINTDSGLVQTPLHSCAEPNWRIKYEEWCLNQIGTAVLAWCGKSKQKL